MVRRGWFGSRSRAVVVLVSVGVFVVAVAFATSGKAYGDAPPLSAAPGADYWSPAGDMPQALAGLGLVAVGNHLTVLGGQIGLSKPVAETHATALGTDGAFVGAWTTSTMPGPRALHGSQVYDNVVYIIGGGAPDPLDSVFAAAVDANGTPFGWSDSVKLPAPRSLAGTAISGRFLYVAGGWGSDYRIHDEVYVAAIGPDGSLTPWRVTRALPAARSNLTLTAARGFLFAIGGSDGSTAQTSVWRARVGEDGQLGVWETLPGLPEPRQDHAAVFFKEQLVVLGGSTGTATSSASTVFAGEVDLDGSLGVWQTNGPVAALPLPVDRHAAAIADLPRCGQVLYVAGGRSKGTYLQSVYRTACEPDAPTPTATATSTATATATAVTGPWANWRNGAVSVVRPGAETTVVLNFANQSPPIALSATLLGPAYFTATGSQRLETALNVINGSYPIGISARRDAGIEEHFYLYARLGGSEAPLLTGTIGRGLFLPINVRGAIVVTPPSVTPTVSPSPTPSPTASSTATSTWTPSPTATATPSATPTWTHTATATFTPTKTPTPRISITPSWTPSATPSLTPSRTPSITPTARATDTPTTRATNTVTPNATWTPSITPSPSQTRTVTISPTHTWTLSPTWTPSVTPSPSTTQTKTPSRTPTYTSTNTWTPSPTWTPGITPSPSDTPSPADTPTPTEIPTSTPTNTPGATTWVTLKQEGFEGDFPNSWTVMDASTNLGDYYWGKRSCRAQSGSYSGWGVGGGDGAGLGCGTTYAYSVEAWMKWGPVSLEDALAADFQYDVWYSTPNEYDSVWAVVSLDNSAWCGYQYYGNVAAWTHGTFDLSSLCNGETAIGKPQIWIAFIFQSDYAWNNPEGVYVDNIVLRKQRVASPSAGIPASAVHWASPPPNKRAMQEPRYYVAKQSAPRRQADVRLSARVKAE